MDRGRGTGKGIPTPVLGASSVDDVFVIVLFIILGMYGVGEVHIWNKPAQIPVSIVLGIAVGLVPVKTMFYRYSRIDPSFQAHWEILYGW